MATSEEMPDTSKAKETVIHISPVPMPADSIKVRGYDFENGVDYDALLKSFLTTGFQATNFGLAVKEVEKMLNWSLADEPIAADEEEELKSIEARKKVKCTIFLGYTSNMISSGCRETIKYLVKNKMVDVLVSTCGGIEEDFMKCMAPTYLGDFALPGKDLRLKGRNRIGNLIIENNNYVLFENWMWPILDQMLKEQKEQGVLWSPSKIINRLGKEIDNPDSVYYWCYKNNIPVFSPAITDGSIGDMIFFHSIKHPGLIVDIASDVRAITKPVLTARKTGVIILGGGVIKHHILNANLMRNGCDFAVYINTAQEFDGSDSGARPDEAVSWGKIKLDATPVKVYCEATTVFPLLVAQTFAKKGSR